jgi:hypothetical protein
MTPCLRQFTIFVVIAYIGTILMLFPVPENTEAAEFRPTSVEVKTACGDGLAEPVNGEVCDPGLAGFFPIDVGTTTCSDFDDIFGNPYVSGDLGCETDCLAYATSTCFTCGNTYKEPIEECDSTNFGGSSCVSLGFESGALHCTNDCRISTANCVAMSNPGGVPGGGSSGGSSGGQTGFNPGSTVQYTTKVVMHGKSYPNSDVHILIDGRVIGIVKTDNKADFYFETSEVPPGVVSFGFWSEDLTGLKSTLLTLTFRVVSGAVTTISGVYISPTIDIDKNSVKQGERVTIFGQTVPETDVYVHINSEVEHVKQLSSGEAGTWQLAFDTTPLEEDFHTAKALFQVNVNGNVIKSGFSKSISFYVGKTGGTPACPEADLNADGRVNLTDFSILLYHWGTNNACADQNQNGVVDLVDFSIMMFYWTG